MEPNQDTRLASSLERTSRLLDLLTAALVVLVSPLSFIVGLPLGIDPRAWLSVWLQYVFIFVVLAITISLLGFAAASSYRVRAAGIRRSMRKG